MSKKILVAVVLCIFVMSGISFAISAQDLIQKIRDNQGKIKDLSADIITTIKTNGKQSKQMEQKGSLLVKGNNQSRMEMKTPMHQIVVVNKDKMLILNPDTGQKMTQDLKKLREKSGVGGDNQNPFDQTKILDTFNLTVKEEGIIGKTYVVIGEPKDKKSMMGKVKFYIDADKMVPTKIEISDSKGKPFTTSNLEYTKIKDIWILSKTQSSVNFPGGAMNVIMKFDNLKVNEGISDKMFEVK